MWQFTNKKELEAVADKLFPQHMTIPGSAFRRARGNYFDIIKDMDHHTKNKFFYSTYYSEGPLCMFTFGDFTYFSIVSNAGLEASLEYYGVVNTNLLIPKYY